MRPLLRSLYIAFCTCLVLVAAAGAAEPVKLQLVIEAGNLNRVNVPVRVPIALAPSTDKSVGKIAAIVDADGKPLAAQITKPNLLAKTSSAGATDEPWELNFILPVLNAGQSLPLSVLIRDAKPNDPAQTAIGFQWHDAPNEYSELTFGGRNVLRYICPTLDESSPEARMRTFKVFHHVYDPHGQQLVTNGGDGGLYPHHRGLFFGFKTVTYDGDKQCDIWHCLLGSHQSHEGITNAEAGQVLGRHRVAVDWHGKDKEVFAKEDREITVYNVSGGTLIEFTSRVRTTGGLVHLDGDPQHAGFHFRAHNDVVAKKDQTYYLRPDGKGALGDTRNWDPKTKEGPANLPWDAMSFMLGDRRYTVAYLDRPTNPKEARFSERDYGRFGSYFEYDVTPERPLEVAYRVWLQDGEMTGDAVAALAQDFVEPVRVTVR
jgi:hypothetical protein